MIHLVVIEIKIGRVVSDAEEHLKVILRFSGQGIKQHLAVVKIFVDVGCAAVGIIKCVNKVEQNAKQDFKNKHSLYSSATYSLALKELHFSNQENEQRGVSCDQ